MQQSISVYDKQRQNTYNALYLMTKWKAQQSSFPTNITHTILNSQITGKSIKHPQQLPSSIFQNLDKRYSGIPFLVSELELASIQKDSTLIRRHLQTCSRKLNDHDSLKTFALFFGTSAISDILYKDPLPTPPSEGRQMTKFLNIQNECCNLLREIYSIIPGNSNSNLIVFLFSLLKENSTFDNAVGLLEEMLASSTNAFDVSMVEDFEEIVKRMGMRQLAFFCRILALLTFDIDQFPDSEDLLKSQDLLSWKRRTRRTNTIESNHKVISNMPLIVERLVKLIHVQNLPSKRWTECNLTSDLLSLLMGFDDSENDWDEPILPLPNENETRPFSFKTLTLVTHQVEILLVICTLLTGQQKSNIQDRLCQSDIIKKMLTCMDSIVWKTTEKCENRPHGPKCECNPESALKIQFLRLVLNYCDCDTKERKKYLLGVENDIEGAMSTELLRKLIKVMISEPLNMNFRFGVASAIESMIRNNDPEYQILTIKSGLLRFTIESILENSEENLQTDFDMLGELVKYNKHAYEYFEKSMDVKEFNKFSTIIITHIVDSNMFIRATILSLNSFNETEIDWKVCRFMKENKMQLFVEILTAVTVDRITQENISCLNTLLVFLLFDSRDQKLRDTIEFVMEYDKKLGRKEVFLIKNMKELIEYWKEYYRESDRDCKNLEVSSRIPYTEWSSTANVVIDMIDNILK